MKGGIEKGTQVFMESGAGKSWYFAFVVVFSSFLTGQLNAVSVSREAQYPWEAPSVSKESGNWADKVLGRSRPDTGSVSATKLSESQTETGIARNEHKIGAIPAVKVDPNDEYVHVIKDSLYGKQTPAAKMPDGGRLIPVVEVPEPGKTVIVGRVRPDYRRVMVYRLFPDDEDGSGAKVLPPANVVKAVPEDEPSNPIYVNVRPAPPISSTRPVVPAIQVPPVKLPELVDRARRAPAIAPPDPRVPYIAPPVKPPNKAADSEAIARFMSKQKPAPVEEEPVPAMKPVKNPAVDKNGVPIASDARAELMTEMVVVSGTGKTLRMTTYLMAKNLLGEGDFSGADRYARSWLEKNPDNWRGWQLLGNIQVELKAYGKALYSYKRSLKINPGNATLQHYVNQAEGIEE